MAYTNATFYVDPETGSDAARTALTTVTVANNGSGLVRCTKAAHGLVTGAVVDVTLNYAGAWIITVIDTSNFDLVTSVYSTATGVTVTPRGGSSKTDAWLTLTSGATTARVAAGDTVRVKSTTDPTLVGTCTWTTQNRAITLPAAVTATISACETAWTASTNVTATAVSGGKEGTNCANLAIAAAFTTGKVAYFATGAINLSTYQQVSFWLQTNLAIAASTLSLRLCTDTLGATSVHTITVPAITATGQWVPVTVDLATNLNAAIASIALYGDLDPGTVTINLDNIIACKASASADSLTLTSLIAKVGNLSWVAATPYALNDYRRPTQPNRNGFRYKCTTAGTSAGSEPTWPTEYTKTVTDNTAVWTCDSTEESWLAIKSISGTTVTIDGSPSSAVNAGPGYSGITESIATYKRETFHQGTSYFGQINTNGTISAFVTYTGGWDRTNMTTQSGETWVSLARMAGANGAINCVARNYNRFYNICGVRGAYSLYDNGSYNFWYNCAGNNGVSGGFYDGATYRSALSVNNLAAWHSLEGVYGIAAGGSYNTWTYTNLSACGNLDAGCLDVNTIKLQAKNCTFLNNASYGYNAYSQVQGTPLFANLVTANNLSSALNGIGDIVAINSTFGEASPFYVQPSSNVYIWSHKHQATANNHLGTTDVGTIISATDQRNTASGISWKFRPTNILCHQYYPLRMSIAKVACTASQSVTATIYTRRDNTNINGVLRLRGGLIAGVPNDITVACAPAINTWVQSGSLTFTPTESGVVEFTFEVYDGVGTVNNFWIDDFAVA